MAQQVSGNEALIQRLPMPLAKLYRRAQNTKSERYLTAYYLWEASMKLLAATAIVVYARKRRQDQTIAKKLARPALGHWRDFVRELVPQLAREGEPGFQPIEELLQGKRRMDLPRAAG